VRCQTADRRGACHFWDCWWTAGHAGRIAFIALVVAAAAFLGAAAYAVFVRGYTAAQWWLTLLGAVVLVLLLPALRTLSGRGFTIELQERDRTAFTVELREAPSLSELGDSAGKAGPASDA